MNKWKGLLLLVFLLAGSTAAYAEEIPLSVVTQDVGQEGELLVSIRCSRPLALEAFTLALEYDPAQWKLYEGNDCPIGGYGYEEKFAKRYQKEGMLLANALEGQVLFSGLSQAQDAMICEGTFAKVSLLALHEQAQADGIKLNISVLRADGRLWESSEEDGDHAIQIFPETDEPPEPSRGENVSSSPAADQLNESNDSASAGDLAQSKQPVLATAELQTDRTQDSAIQQAENTVVRTGTPQIADNEPIISAIPTIFQEKGAREGVSAGWKLLGEVVCGVVVLGIVFFIKIKKGVK